MPKTWRAEKRSWRSQPVVQIAAGIAVMLCLLAIARSWWGTRLDSFTIDEPWHIVAGTTYARTGDYTLNPEHPPLVKLWVGTTAPAEPNTPTSPARGAPRRAPGQASAIGATGASGSAGCRHRASACWTGWRASGPDGPPRSAG